MASVLLTTEVVRRTRSADVIRVSMTQGERRIASRQHAEDPPRFIAPSLDLYVAFHQDAGARSWLLSDVTAPISAGGLIGAQGRVWDDGGRLVASGQSQLLCRPVPPT